VNEITAELKSLKSELDQHTKDSSQYGQVGHTKSFSNSCYIDRYRYGI
jgi:hypothetical protein